MDCDSGVTGTDTVSKSGCFHQLFRTIVSRIATSLLLALSSREKVNINQPPTL